MPPSHVLLLLAALCATPAPAVAAPTPVPMKDGFPVTRSDALYPLHKIKRGQRGIGYTVFSGDKPEPFEFEVLGLMKGMLGPGKDVILARLEGKNIEFTGVISGMSGSPTYIDGKLVGAVAYRFGVFSREPIAGITPIQSMLDVYDLPAPKGGKTVGGGVKMSPISMAQFRDPEHLPALSLPAQPTPGSAGMVPLSIPLAVSGMTPSSMASLKEVLAPAGFMVTAGSSGGATPYAPRDSRDRKVQANLPGEVGTVPAAPIAPAAPIGAFLMRGDINVTAIGTVTMVENGRVLAFGHPFMGFGKVDFPMATAAIINTLASPAGSYKQGAGALEVGSITEDRLTMIGGQLGAVAPMVPVRVDIKTSKGKSPSSNHFEIVDDPMWLPVMLENAIASASSRRLGYEAGGTVDVSVRVLMEGGELSFRDSYAAPAPTQVTSYAARDAATSLGMLVRNELAPAKVRGVEIEVAGTREVQLSEVVDAWSNTSVVKPGEMLPITVRLRRFRGEHYTVNLAVKVPESVEAKEITIVVGGGMELDRHDQKTRGARTPSDLQDLRHILADRRPSRALYARLSFEAPGVQRRMESLDALPPSVNATLRSDSSGRVRATTRSLATSASASTQDVVSGSKILKIRVLSDLKKP